MKFKLPALLTLTLLAFSSMAEALEVDRIYGSNMVLQQGMKLPIRGKAAPDSEVSLTFAGQSVSGKASGEGNWTLHLQPLKTSKENRDMEIKGDGKTVTLKNILVGEVWLGSGQSNMAGKVGGYAKNDPTLAEIAGITNLLLRLRDNTGWHSSSPTKNNGHSAILFAFGERLQRELDVPVGLYFGAVGGTPSGAWIPKETYDSSEKIKGVVAEFAKNYDHKGAMKLYEKKVAAWEKAQAKAKAEGQKVRGRKPQPPGLPGTSTRGGAIGGLFDRHIRYSVGFPIRGVLWDQGEARSGILGLDQHTSMSELIRGWRELWGQGDFPFLFVQKPSGNGNAWSTEDPITREGQSFSKLPLAPGQGDEGYQRYLYVRLMHDNANSWMVPACDLGATIHPKNKWGYGNRAAEVAAQKVYQKEGVQAFGPIYASHKIEGDQVIIKFKETGSGLATKHSDQLQGFSISGKDGKWHWATAKITASDTVTMTSNSVKSPKHIRFAYSNNRTWANLFNKEGLPALAFTTEN